MCSNNNFEQTSNNLLSAWEADTISPTGMHILCIALRYNKSENHIYYTSLIKVELRFYSFLN